MKISDLVLMCVRNLTRRKFRTFLTVTGVVIGTTSIVVMISLGVGISSSFEQMLAGSGDLTMIDVYAQSADSPITDDSVAQIQALPGVVIASPTMRYYPNNGWMQLYAGRKDRYESYANLMGVYPEALEALGYTAYEGELSLGTEGKKIKMIMGPQVPYDFYDTRKRWPNNGIYASYDDPEAPDPFFDPMETEMSLKVFSNKENVKTLEYDVIVSGIIQPKSNDWQPVYSTYISIDDFKQIKADFERENKVQKEPGETDSYEEVKVKCDHVSSVGDVQTAIKDMGFYPQSMEETRQAIESTMNQIQMILGILGAVALLVAAISITNTMIMSVYERTREIGVMKVLGCLVGNIRGVFLLEAGLIGFFGGVLGIGVSYLLSYLFNKYGSSFASSMVEIMPTEGARLSIIPPWLVLTGLVVATSIGLMAGFYPANRAVRISALEAIKQE